MRRSSRRTPRSWQKRTSKVSSASSLWYLRPDRALVLQEVGDGGIEALGHAEHLFSMAQGNFTQGLDGHLGVDLGGARRAMAHEVTDRP